MVRLPALNPHIVFVSRFNKNRQVVYKLDKSGKLIDNPKETTLERNLQNIQKLPPKLKIKLVTNEQAANPKVSSEVCNSITEILQEPTLI